MKKRTVKSKIRGVCRKVAAAVLAAAVTLGAGNLTGNVAAVQAAEKAHMETLNVSWDLKNDKAVKIKARCYSFGLVDEKCKITNYKVKNSKKKGYKELTFTFEADERVKLSKKKLKKIIHSKELDRFVISDGGSFTVLDYNTGKNLEVTGDEYDVTVKADYQEQKILKEKFYECPCGCGDGAYGFVRAYKVKVTYPKDYDGLCIGIYSAGKEIETEGDYLYREKGTVPFGDTSHWSKKDKKRAHFMRVKN